VVDVVEVEVEVVDVVEVEVVEVVVGPQEYPVPHAVLPLTGQLSGHVSP